MPESPPLTMVGREREFSRLRLLAADVEQGSSHCILLCGEAGSGRSRLCEELARVLGGGSGKWTLHSGRAALPRAVEDARTGPVLLIVDETGESARPLAAVLAQVPDLARGLPLMALATSGLPAPVLAGWEALRLDPLSPPDVARLAEELTGRRLDDAATRRLATLAAGNPLLVVTAIPPGSTAAIHAVLRARLEGLADLNTGILRAVALLGEAATTARVGALLGRDAAKSLQSLEECGWVCHAPPAHHHAQGTWTLRPPVLRSLLLSDPVATAEGDPGKAALALLESDVTDAVSLAAAAELRESNDSAEAARAGWLLAAQAANRAEMSAPALAAAGHALRLGAGAEARVEAAQALAGLSRWQDAEREASLVCASDSGDCRARALLVLAMIRMHQARFKESSELAAQACDLSSSQGLKARARLLVARVALLMGQPTEARSIHERLRAGIEPVLQALHPVESARLESSLDLLESEALTVEGRRDEAAAVALRGLARAAAARNLVQEGSLHKQLASIYRNQGRLDDASREVLSAMNCLRLAGDAQKLTIAKSLSSTILLDRGVPARAVAEFEEHAKAWRAAGEDRLLSGVLLHLSRGQMMMGEEEASEATAADCCGVSRRLGDRQFLVSALMQLSSIRSKRGKFGEAESTLREAIALVEQGDARSLLPTLLNNLGNIHVRAGEPGKAIGPYERALALRPHSRDKVATARLLCNLGIVSVRLGRFEQGRAYLVRAQSLNADFRNASERSLVPHALGQVDLLQGRLLSARTQLETARSTLQESPNPRELCMVLSDLADLIRIEGDLRSAEAAAQEALEVAETVDDGPVTGPLAHLAATALAADRPEEAVTHAASALARAGVLSTTTDDVQWARIQLGRAAFSLGDVARGAAVVRELVEVLGAKDDTFFRAPILALAARAAQSGGCLERARELITAARQAMDDPRVPFVVRLDTGVDLVACLGAEGRGAEAEAVVEELGVAAERVGAFGPVAVLERVLARHAGAHK